MKTIQLPLPAKITCLLFLLFILPLTGLKAQVAASFTQTDSIGCGPLCVIFQNTTPGAITCHWNFGDPASGSADSASGLTVTHCFATAATYTVTMTVHTSSGNGTCAHHVLVFPTPEASFTVTNVSGNTWHFTNTSTGATSQNWSFGDSTAVDTALSPTHTYAHTGAHAVYLIVTNSYGCSDTATFSLATAIHEIRNDTWFNVLPNPSADGLFRISLKTGVEERFTYEVINTLGQTVLSRQSQESGLTIDLSAQSRGLYFLMLHKGEQTFTHRLIISK